MGRAALIGLNILVAFIVLHALIVSQPVAATRSLLAHHGPKTHHLHWMVETKNVTRNCNETVAIATVNGMYPGPTLDINEGDTMVIKVTSNVDTDVTLHWHGINQWLTNWADGPTHITQCPLTRGGSYTYEFVVLNQSGTFFWHAHVHWLRASVYGAIIVHPKAKAPYATPVAEIPMLLGEWFPMNPDVVEALGMASHTAYFTLSSAYTINGLTGPLYKCSTDSLTLKFVPGKTYLFRIVSGSINTNFFFSIANHTMSVVAADGEYVKPFNTSVLMISPGQSTDVLVTADQAVGKYYFGISEWRPVDTVIYPTLTPSVGVIKYPGSSSSSNSTPTSPTWPDIHNNELSHAFSARILGLSAYKLPHKMDRDFFFVAGLTNIVCTREEKCESTGGTKLGTAINNVTFENPKNTSILHAYYYHKNENKAGRARVYTTDFPTYPLGIVNFTAPGNVPAYNVTSHRGTKVIELKYNQTVQIVLQNVDEDGLDDHPMHLHGHNFYVVGRGFGNYNATSDPKKFNLRDPPLRNTVGLPDGGWVAIRFLANNPGVWLLHCHVERHSSWGMMMAFIVRNGEKKGQRLPHPKHPSPTCFYDQNP